MQGDYMGLTPRLSTFSNEMYFAKMYTTLRQYYPNKKVGYLNIK